MMIRRRNRIALVGLGVLIQNHAFEKISCGVRAIHVESLIGAAVPLGLPS